MNCYLKEVDAWLIFSDMWVNYIQLSMQMISCTRECLCYWIKSLRNIEHVPYNTLKYMQNTGYHRRVGCTIFVLMCCYDGTRTWVRLFHCPEMDHHTWNTVMSLLMASRHKPKVCDMQCVHHVSSIHRLSSVAICWGKTCTCSKFITVLSTPNEITH